MKYVFKNRYGTVLHVGTYMSDFAAWEGFFDDCEYPSHARNIAETINYGIYCTKE